MAWLLLRASRVYVNESKYQNLTQSSNQRLMSVIFIQQTIIFECCMCHSLLASFVFYISPCQKKTSLLLLWIFIVGQDPELQWLMALGIGWCQCLLPAEPESKQAFSEGMWKLLLWRRVCVGKWTFNNASSLFKLISMWAPLGVKCHEDIMM